VWAGQVSVLVSYGRASTGENLGNFTLTLVGGASTDVSTRTIEGYLLKLVGVEPSPISTKQLKPTDYVSTFLVLKADANISEAIVASNPVALDSDSGEIIENLKVGKEVMVSMALHNGFDDDRQFIALIEARSLGDGGVTRFLAMPNGIVAGKGWTDVGLSWTPELAGDYQLRTFVIDSLNGPQILSPVMTSKVTVEAGSLSDSDTAEVIEGNNQLAFDFYSKVIKDDGNIFYSPWSISTAFALVYEGAREKTSEEIQSLFGFPSDDDKRRSSFAGIQDDLNSQQANYTLTTANALWIDEGFKLSDSYVDVARQYYDSEISTVDFPTEESRLQINEWVESKTNEKIKDVIPQGILTALTRLVITNAIYFKGTWVTQFDERNTVEEDFRIDADNTVKVPMMKLGETYFKYAETDSIKIIDLPYHGEKLSMLVLLPKNDTGMQSLEESLTLENLDTWRSSLRNQSVTVHIPKFKLETSYALNDMLREMGMPSAFTPDDADLSGINGVKGLFIQSALHKAFVEVNEEGTEAAAATVIVIGPTSEQPQPPLFRADHPFIFIIQDSETGNILFMGRITNPSTAIAG
jgi:serpin B